MMTIFKAVLGTVVLGCGIASGLFVGIRADGAQAAAKGQQVSKSKASISPRLVIGGSTVSQTLFAYSVTNSTVGSSETYATFPGMSVQFTIAGTQKIVLATFGAESACYGGDVGSDDRCVVRIFATGAGNFQPCPGDCTDFAFTSTEKGTATSSRLNQHQMTRGKILLHGTYTLSVQGRVKRFGTAIPTFWTGERTLTVQVIEP